ncbi:MAG TPA: TonB-dependent receptor [Woeseiaceae bacterium]|nr:TonB-dependent receptor [Woeseiaceae bacterium]
MKTHDLRPGALWSLLGWSALAIAPGAIYAQATETPQEPSEEIEEIITTGTRIRSDDFTSATPMTVIDGQSIIDQGLSNLGEALRQQTSIGTGGFNQSSILSGGGATSVDLRNLGPDRVLILINGRRVASFADSLANQAADLTFIPTAMVERVEILRDGASAVYGSDAITGVINVILKKDFEGVELNLQTGATEEGDGESQNVSLTLGSATDRGNFIVGAEYRRQDPVKQRDRDWAFPSISALGATATNGSVFSPGGLFLGDGGAVFCTQAKALGGDEVTDVTATDPTFCGLAAGQNVSSPDDVVLKRYDYALQQDLIIGSEVTSASFYGNYELTEGINAFVESQVAKRLGTRHLDGNPGSFGTPAFPDGSRVPASNPNNPTGEDGLFLFRPTSTIGPRTEDQESNTLRVVAGVDGDLPFGDGDWYYEASVLYTRVDATLNTNYSWNLARFIRISDPDLCAADALCAATVNPSGALDSFRPGNWTQAEIEYLRHTSGATSKFETTGYQAFVSGPLFDLPAGALHGAFGVERREDTGFNQPDSVTESGESVSNQVFTTQGGFDVNEFFTEFDVPLLADVPAAQDLTLNLQWRISDYDTFGSEDVYRVGLNWRVNDWLRLRANKSTAYRAPTVTDLFGGGTVSFDFFTPDICDASQSGIMPGSNAYQNCLLDGVDPATFSQPASQYSVLAGSNPELQPETADTATYGLVLTPAGVLDGLQLSLDFWDIEVDDLISRNTSQSVLDDCYEGPVGLTAPECEQFDRNPNTGVPVAFVNRLSNLDKVETNGFDAAIAYAFDGFADTSWKVTLLGTYVDENTFEPGTGGADDRGSIPRVQANLRTDLYYRDWSFAWTMRFVSSMSDPDFEGDNVFGYDGVPSYKNHDLRVVYNWSDKYRLLLGVNNLADEDPPYVFSSGNNTDVFLYDVFGRFWFARMTVSIGSL